MKKHIILNLLFLIIISSCSKYQKVLKSNDLTYKYEQALLYYNNKDFKRALPLFSELHQVMIGTANMQSVSYYFAYCHYATGDNLMAAYLFEQYVKTFPNHKHTEECSYMTAYCYYLETPNYSLDPTNNYKAIKKLQEHINKYPNSKRTKECNTLIDELRKKLSNKAFENAKQYFTTENYKSAIISLNNMLIDFPSFQ